VNTVTAVVAVAGVVLAVAGILLGRIFTETIHVMDRGGKVRRALGICLLSAGVFVTIVGFTDVKPLAPKWRKQEPAGLAEARADDAPVLLDFWADWCAACKELDRTFFPREEVRGALADGRFVPIKVDLSAETDENEALYEKYGILGLPTFALVRWSGGEQERLILDAKALDDPEAILCALRRFPSEGPTVRATCAAGTDDTLEQALAGNLLLALLLVFLGGVASSFTPCVYPMIPITIALFGAKDAGGRLRSFLLSLTYVGGIAITFTALGVAAAWTGGLFGEALQSPWVVGGIAGVLLALGLSMVGLYALRLPASVQQRLGGVGGQGWAGALVLGLLAGVLFAPCVGPVLVTLLAHIARERDLMLGVLLMADYALGMGMLFLVLGTFSGAVARRPRGGNWLEGVEVALGCLLIAMSLFYLRDLIGPLGSLVPWVQSILT